MMKLLRCSRAFAATAGSSQVTVRQPAWAVDVPNQNPAVTVAAISKRRIEVFAISLSPYGQVARAARSRTRLPQVYVMRLGVLWHVRRNLRAREAVLELEECRLKEGDGLDCSACPSRAR
jgi:hypothetical protein